MQEPTAIPGAAEFASMLRDLGLPGEVTGIRPLAGGFSSDVVSMDLVGAGGRRHGLVARRHGRSALAQNPRLARQEYELLKVLSREGLPVPEPVGLSTSSQVGEAAWLFVTRLENSPDACPDDPLVIAETIAHLLAAIHDVDPQVAGLGFLPEKAAVVDRLLQQPAVCDTERRIRAVLGLRWPPAFGPRRDTVLHGDLWAGNVLWNDGAVAGVIDWEDAARGDPLADLANTRLETLWAYGRDATDRLTAAYLDRTGQPADSLPLWDLVAALVLARAREREDWGHSREENARMTRQLEEFVGAACFALG